MIELQCRVEATCKRAFGKPIRTKFRRLFAKSRPIARYRERNF